MKENESQASEDITDTQERAYEMSLVETKPPPPHAAAALATSKFTLQGILKKV